MNALQETLHSWRWHWWPSPQRRAERGNEAFTRSLIGSAFSVAWAIGYLLTLFPGSTVWVAYLAIAFAAFYAVYGWLLIWTSRD
jgi:hypothetical protein